LALRLKGATLYAGTEIVPVVSTIKVV